jgi:hypothetical protein
MAEGAGRVCFGAGDIEVGAVGVLGPEFRRLGVRGVRGAGDGDAELVNGRAVGVERCVAGLVRPGAGCWWRRSPALYGGVRPRGRLLRCGTDRRGEWSLGWGSRGRRFKSCRPDQHHRRSEAVSAGSGGGLNHFRAGSKWEPSGSPRAPNSQTCQRCPIRPSPDRVDLPRRIGFLCAVVNRRPPTSPHRFGCPLHREA